MSSVAVGAFGENPINLAHVLSQNSATRTGPDITPIVFLVLDDVSDRESLETLVCDNGWYPETFASVQEFLSEPAELVPSCLVFQVSQDFNSVEMQKRLATERPETPIILVARNGNVRMAVQAIKAGAIEFLTNPFVGDLLVDAIRQALDRSQATLARQTQIRALKECYGTLTPREREVMTLVVSGRLNKEVGAELDITERTVKGHRGRMMQKMKASSLAELVKMATKLRLPALKSSATFSPNYCASQVVA